MEEKRGERRREEWSFAITLTTPSCRVEHANIHRQCIAPTECTQE